MKWPLLQFPTQQKHSTNLYISIFPQIPIVTLRAVNDLVQSIAGNLQAAGSGTYFNNQRSRNEKEYKVIMMTQSPATTSGAEHTERIDIWSAGGSAMKDYNIKFKRYIIADM